MMREPTFSQRAVLLLVLLGALIWFCNLDYRKLVRPDEGRYAEIPREMVATGDYLTPRLNGLKYFEKPALQYWATAVSYEVFGEKHWAARIWPALTGFFTILFTAFAGMRLWGRTAGIYAGLICASAVLFIGIGHLLTLDMGVSCFLNMGVLCLALAQRARTEPEARNWMLTGWAALGLAILSKGLIGAVLPGAAFVVYSVICADLAAWKKLYIGRGIAVMLAVTAPWFIWVCIANPDFFNFFFIHEHWDRFLKSEHKRTGVWFYFIPILLAGMMPWTFTLFAALPRLWRREPIQGFQPRRFLIVWSVLVFVFFSMSQSKLPSYILPIFPALALLIGERLTVMKPRTLFWSIVPLVLCGVALAIYAPFVIRHASDEVPVALYSNYVPWLLAAGVIVAVGMAVAAWWARGGRVQAAVTLMAATGLIGGQVGLTGHESLARASSSYYIVPPILAAMRMDKPFYSLGMYEQTLPFYIKRTVTLVEFRDELDFGLKADPEKGLPNYVEFAKRWMQPDNQGAMAIMNPNSLAYFDQHGLPYEIIARDTRRIVVRRP